MEFVRAQINHYSIEKAVKIVKNKFFLYIVSRFANHGNLKDQMFQVHGYTEPQIARMIKQLLEGLNVMHQNNFCHRNVKPENIQVISVNNSL